MTTKLFYKQLTTLTTILLLLVTLNYTKGSIEVHKSEQETFLVRTNLTKVNKTTIKANSAKLKEQHENAFNDFSQPEIKEWINRYSKKQWGYQLSKSLQNGQFYQEFILSRIDHYELPRELFYLPIVESRYINSANSYMGAEGIWQFMENSATPYGLKIDQWRDDRRDFWLATDAALKKLKTNYRVTNDWLLAIAAYNCGLGRVKSEMKRTGLNSFWELKRVGALPDETADYIPKLLAVIYIASNPKEYNIELKRETITWKRIPISNQISIKELSQKSGIGYSLLKKANAELIGDLTPISKKPYYLKIPAIHFKNAEATINNNLEKIPNSL